VRFWLASSHRMPCAARHCGSLIPADWAFLRWASPVGVAVPAGAEECRKVPSKMTIKLGGRR
jgi:hypothetical protein